MTDDDPDAHAGEAVGLGERATDQDVRVLPEFGEERRAVVSIAQVPPELKNAIIAAEDEADAIRNWMISALVKAARC